MSTVQKLVIPAETGRGRPIIEISMKLPDGTFSEYMKYNFDTGASWPTDVAPQILSKFGGYVSSSARKEQAGEIKIKGLAGSYKIPIMVQDKAHYDLFKEQPPPIRYPLCRVRDLAKYMSFVFAKENTTIAIGTTQPQELKDAVTAKKTIARLADMRQRENTPTKGWQWYKADLVNPSTGAKKNDWFPINTGERQGVVKRSLADAIKLSYPSLGSDGRADTKATITFTESNPILSLNNVTVQVRDDNQDFARGGDPRNLLGGPPILNNWKIVLWSQYLHLAFIPRS